MNTSSLSLPVLDTPRLQLCRPDVGLAERLTEALNASYALHQPFLDWARDDWTVEESRQRLRTAASDFDSPGREHRYYLLHKASGALVGCVGLRARQTQYELGYWASVGHAGQGYLYEALQVLLAPFGPGQLLLTTSSRNLASQKLAARLGFVCQGSEERPGAVEGETTLVYGR
ncbi:MAG: GNAT family N-acetyltransferase [Pseudomonas sp.]|uniref:GNAT family N-acetyltransferase n=1 Tax=Pseudomonas sp. TaxID=306 RepID=UPI003D0F80A2